MAPKKAARADRDEYDWLEDPFDEEKSAKELERARSSSRRGCMLLVIVVSVLAILVVVGTAGLGWLMLFSTSAA